MASPFQKPSRASVRMLATCSGAKPGASSITTRPPGTSMYSVLAGSSVRQSASGEASRISLALRYFGGSAACAAGRANRQASSRGVRRMDVPGLGMPGL